MATNLPPIISDMFDQLGRGMRGAICYTGGKRPAYNCVHPDTYPDFESSVNDDGYLKAQCYIQFDVNVKRSQIWRMIVCYEPSDTYTVYLLKLNSINKMSETGKASEVIASYQSVYCDQLQAIVESTYDEAIKKYNGGFINI